MPLPQHQPPQSHAYASPQSRACPSQPPCRFDTNVESQNRLSENPADSANCENALGVERASYAASLAERRYRAVDPDNRLVARGLERAWEESLTSLEAAKAELAR